jgi:hypothetical protein
MNVRSVENAVEAGAALDGGQSAVEALADELAVDVGDLA